MSSMKTGQKPQPLVSAFAGRPPDAIMLDLAHTFSGGVSREMIGKVMAGASAHHHHTRMPALARVNAVAMSAPAVRGPSRKSFASSLSAPKQSVLSSAVSLVFGGSNVLRNTGYVAPRLAPRGAAPAPALRMAA